MRTFAHKAYAAALIVSFVLSLVMVAPAQLLLQTRTIDSLELDFDLARGTIWQGQSASVLVNGMPVGALEYELVPSSVLAFSPAIEWSVRNSAHHLHGIFNAGVGEVLIEDTEVETSLSALRIPVRMVGQATVTLDQLRLIALECERAEGVVTLVGSTVDGVRQPLDLNGPLTCQDGAVLAPLSGRLGDYPLRVDLTYHPDSSIEYFVSLTAADTAIAYGLATLGFQQNGPAYELAGRMSLFP